MSNTQPEGTASVHMGIGQSCLLTVLTTRDSHLIYYLL